jgi:hypothetical protein
LRYFKSRHTGPGNVVASVVITTLVCFTQTSNAIRLDGVVIGMSGILDRA